MNRVLKKTIAFTLFLAMLITGIMPSLSIFAADKDTYTLKILGDNEYSDGVRFGSGYLMLKNGKFDNINPKTEFIYIDEQGKKKEIKNDVGFTQVYLNTSGNTYYVDYSVLAIGKDNKVGLMDVNGKMYGGANSFYDCVIHAGDGLFYTTNATANIDDKANTKIWTLRRKDGSVVKEFKNLNIYAGGGQDVGTRANSNGYEYINHYENSVSELLAIDKNGNIKNLGSGYSYFNVDSQNGFVVAYKGGNKNTKSSITVFNPDGSKVLSVDGYSSIEVNQLKKYGYAKVSSGGYNDNIVDTNGKLMLDGEKYGYIKSYDDKRALAMDTTGNVFLVDYSNNVKFDAKEFAKKFGESYIPVTFGAYYVDSTMGITIKDSNNNDHPGVSFFFDNDSNMISGNIKGYISDFDGTHSILFDKSNESYGVINKNGSWLKTDYDNANLEVGYNINERDFISYEDIYENGIGKGYFPKGYETDVFERKEFKSNIVARGRKTSDKKVYLIFNNGNVIDRYSRVEKFINGHAIVEDNVTKGKGVIDLQGNEIVKTGEYESFIQYRNSECFVGYKGGQAYLFDANGKLLTEKNQFKKIGDYITRFYEYLPIDKNFKEYKNRIFSNNMAITVDSLEKLGLIRVVKDVPVTGITIDKSYVVLPMGQTEKLSAIITPSDAVNKDVQWSSSNEKVATVDVNGLVKTVGKGSAIIMAKSISSGLTTTSEIKVVNNIDVNKDNKIDITDIAMIAIDYEKTSSQTNFNKSLDINSDGIIDIYDLIICATRM